MVTLAKLVAITTVALLVLYEAALARAQRREPLWLTRSSHATLRGDWVDAFGP